MQLQSIQGLRAIAALAVLVSHIAQGEMRFLPDPVSQYWMVAGVSGVDLFFVISGFVMVYVTRQTGAYSPSQIGRFAYARVTRIYPIYWAFTIAVITAYLVLDVGLTRSLSDFNLFKNFLLLPDHIPPILLVAWTLIHEMYFYLIFALFLFAPPRWLTALLVVWAMIIIGSNAFDLNTANAWTRIAFHTLTMEFILGCCAGLLVTSGRRRFGSVAVALGVAGWIIASVLLAPYQSFTDVPQGWDRVLAWGVPAALIVYGMTCLEIDRGLTVPGSLVRVGDWSYALYLCHLPIVALMPRLWSSHGPDLGWIDNIAMMLIGAAASLAVAACAHYLFERPVLRYARVLGKTIFKTSPPAEARAPAGRIW